MNTMRFENDVDSIFFSALNQVGPRFDPAFVEQRIRTANRRFLAGRLPFSAFLARRAAEEAYGNGARYDVFYRPADILRLCSAPAEFSWRGSRC